MKKYKEWGPFLLVSGCLLLVVEVCVRLGMIPDFIIPSPSSVIVFLWQNGWSLLTEHTGMTLLETVLGFGLAVVIGSTLALTMSLLPWLKRIVYPFVLLSQTIPTIALAPIFILWFGYTIWSKVAIAFLIAFFPIVIGLLDGLQSTPTERLELFDSLGATKRQRLWHLMLPHALPQLMSSLKMAIVYALVGASIGEWMGASQGLGYYSRRMSGNLNAQGVFASIVLLSLLGMLLFLLMRLVEKKVIFWKK
jgi:ABC-type nitrate/sulfonate/bicarbonate transport system, permease component